MSDNKPACDISVEKRACKKTGRYYDRDDGKTRCTPHQKKHERMIAGYIADMAQTRRTHPHLVN